VSPVGDGLKGERAAEYQNGNLKAKLVHENNSI
jgi:hypothetical protein